MKKRVNLAAWLVAALLLVGVGGAAAVLVLNWADLGGSGTDIAARDGGAELGADAGAELGADGSRDDIGELLAEIQLGAEYGQADFAPDAADAAGVADVWEMQDGGRAAEAADALGVGSESLSESLSESVSLSQAFDESRREAEAAPGEGGGDVAPYAESLGVGASESVSAKVSASSAQGDGSGEPSGDAGGSGSSQSIGEPPGEGGGESESASSAISASLSMSLSVSEMPEESLVRLAMHVQVVNANGVLVIGDNQYFDVVISSGAYARTVRLRHGGSAEIVIPGGEYAVSVGESDLGARYEYLALIGPDGLIGDGVPLDLSGRGSANVTAVIKVAGVPTALAGKLIVTKQVFCDGELLPPDPAQTFRVTAYGIVADAKDNISTFSDFADVPQGGSHTFDTGRGSIDVMEPRAAADTGFELAGMFNLSAWAAGPSLGSTNEIASVGRTRGAGVLIFNKATPRAAPPPPSDGPADGDPGGVPETGYPAIGGDGDGTASRPPSYGSPADSIPTAVDTAKAATEPEEPETQVAEAAEAAAEASVGDERIRDIRVPRGSAASSGESLPVAALTQNRVAYINGYQDGTVGPDNIVTRAEAAAMMFRLLSESSKSGLARSRFPDVPDSAWYAESVNCLAAVGVVAGYEDNRFKPDLPVTRAEFVTIISRFAEPDAGSLAANPPGLPGAKFSDVVGHWAENQIMKACARGWVNGYDGGEFKPQAGVTRAEAVTIMNRVLGRHSYGLPAADAISPFADILPTHWAFAAIVEAAAVA